MTAITVYEGAQAPEQYTLTIRQSGFDFTSVISAESRIVSLAAPDTLLLGGTSP